MLEWLVALAEDLTTLAVFVAIATWSYAKWQRTLGRQRALERCVELLGPEMQADYFIQHLGAPTFRRQSSGFEEMVWVEPDAFIRALSLKGTVKVVAVTTRNKRFSPTFYKGHVISAEGHTLEVRLGRTTFGGLPGSPFAISGAVGARRWGYSEAYSFGNPGLYQSFVYSISDAGWNPTNSGDLQTVLVSRGSVDVGVGPAGSDAVWSMDSEFLTARTVASFNTLTILAPDWQEDFRVLGITPGADLDLVRLDPRARV